MLIKTRSLSTPKQLHTQLPLSSEQKSQISSVREEVRNIFNGKDNRMLLIIGPCSIHDPIAAKQYAINLKQLSKEVSDTFLILMRVYFEKPRTVLGWKGMLNDPHLDGSNDIEMGIYKTRKLLLELASLEVPTAAELLDPFSVNYVIDLITWGCIGARTVSSQIHRQIASGLPMPVAFKNSTDGNIAHAVNGVKAASIPHTFLGIDDDGQIAKHHTAGNNDCHIVLRGGENSPNYDPQSITRAQSLLRDSGLNEGLIIDCSHDNCGGIFEHQRVVFQSAINQHAEGNPSIKGIIIESYLESGNQAVGPNLNYGVSITDPCIDWATTEQLIRWGRAKLLSVKNPLSTQIRVPHTLCSVD